MAQTRKRARDMFLADHIKAYVDLLNRRQVLLYHACQYDDYCSYLSLGGIPSRQKLQEAGAVFTAFATDQTDRERGVWDKVFVNLVDFGDWFARGWQAVPNPYGPILLVISPDSLLRAQDVAICLRSAGANGFNRENEALKTLDEAQALFFHPNAFGPPRSTMFKFGDELKQAFGNPNATHPEISCSFIDGCLPLDYVQNIVVDPYLCCGHALVHWVIEANRSMNRFIPVTQRKCMEGTRTPLYRELAAVSLNSSALPSIESLAADPARSEPLRAWAQQIIGKGLGWQFERYAKYLLDGTLIPLEAGE